MFSEPHGFYEEQTLCECCCVFLLMCVYVCEGVCVLGGD